MTDMSKTENVEQRADKRVGRYIVRCPWNGELNPELVELEARGCGSARGCDAWLEDTTKPGQVVHADGGAPEDQTLHRDLSSLVDELNKLADELMQAQKLAASRREQIEDLQWIDDEITWLRSTAFVYANSATARRINRIAQASARALSAKGATE